MIKPMNTDRHFTENSSITVNNEEHQNSNINVQNVQDSQIIPQPEQHKDLFKISIDDFNTLNHPLDVIEQIYTSNYQLSEYYGINELQGPPPSNDLALLSEAEFIALKFLIRYRKLALIFTILKMVFCPITFLIDLLGLKAIYDVDAHKIGAYCSILVFIICGRIIVLIVISVQSGDSTGIGLAIWIFMTNILEIPQVLFAIKATKRLKDYQKEILKKV